jgi:hypothetical protein
LIRHPDIHEMLARLSNAGRDKNWLRSKAAIWAVANVAVSHEGACFIDREGGIESLINITETSTVLSLKATAFYGLSLVATTRHGCQVLASKGWCTLKYGRDDSWPVLEDWFLRFQLATVVDTMDGADIFDQNDHNEINAADNITNSGGSLAACNTPSIEDQGQILEQNHQHDDDDVDDHYDHEVIPRSSSLSSRKRLSNFFKSVSDKKSSSGSAGGGKAADHHTGESLTRKIKRSLFKEDLQGSKSLDHSSAHVPVQEVAVVVPPPKEVIGAPIATPEKSSKSSRSSSGDTLEGIKEEIVVFSDASSSEASLVLKASTSFGIGAKLSPIASSSSMMSSSLKQPGLASAALDMKPMRFKNRSGKRAYSESEAAAFLKSSQVTASTIVPGASITSVASTGSYTDNPGYHTLRSIHNRHRPALVFNEANDDETPVSVINLLIF